MISRKWRVLGGEPPDGSANGMPRISIRSTLSVGRMHSKDTKKVDIMCYKSGVLLLIELKAFFSTQDKIKLDNIVSVRKQDLFNAIEERTNVRSAQIIRIAKALAFSDCSKFSLPEDYFILTVTSKGDVVIHRGSDLNDISI